MFIIRGRASFLSPLTNLPQLARIGMFQSGRPFSCVKGKLTMKMAALVTLLPAILLLVLGGTAVAQEPPLPSVTLEVQAAAGCVLRLYANDLGVEDTVNGPYDALRGYDVRLSYPPAITVTAVPVNSWYNHAQAITFISGCSAGECQFVIFGLSPGVSGSGPLQELTLSGTGTGELAFVEPTRLTGFGGSIISHTRGASIDVTSCEPTAVRGPLGRQASGGGGSFFVVAALGLLALSALGLRRAVGARTAV
jgi:hypothetical protein